MVRVQLERAVVVGRAVAVRISVEDRLLCAVVLQGIYRSGAERAVEARLPLRNVGATLRGFGLEEES